jgi:hypothetical protein
MKRNAIASKSPLIIKLVGVIVATVLSGCAMTGPSSGELRAEMPFSDVHYGP